jgi:hypothetical protein
VPIEVGRLPRGVAIQPDLRGTPSQLTLTPYNFDPVLASYPNDPLHVEAGRTSTVEVHTGALHETHSLVTYDSQGRTRGITLHYDSLRAEPRPLYYFAIAGLDQTGSDKRFIARLDARLGEFVASADGMSSEEAFKLGLQGGENFYKLPGSAEKDATYGAALPIDLTDGPSGVYTFALDYGTFKETKDGYTGGRFVTQTTPVAVVNGTKSAFGAGWGIAGYMELFTGDGSVLLVDGDGNEQIFLAPQQFGQPFTPLGTDFSELRQNSEGNFVRRLRDGTVYEFDAVHP